jgi:hypothetical protein
MMGSLRDCVPPLNGGDWVSDPPDPGFTTLEISTTYKTLKATPAIVLY